jgi:prepilin-type processing-associated H-X9-DG protein
LLKVIKAGLMAAKEAKFEVDGTEARATVTLPLEGLPLASAYVTAVLRAQQAAAVQQSANNLRQIGIAVHTYHDTNNSLPPAAVCDKKGKPQLSWRVLILPYIEQNELYKQFKLDEPWDSANNKKLLAKMPSTYAMPGKTKPGETDTYYRVFVGNDAGWDWLMAPRFPAAFTDGTSNTVMVVTAAESVPWTKPDELEFDPEKDMTKLIGMVVNGKAQMAMFDGSVRTFSKLPSKTTIHGAITRSGGEILGPDF